MRAAPIGLYFGIDGACDLVTREEIRSATVLLIFVPGIRFLLVVSGFGFEEIRNIIEHETFTLRVLEGTAIAPYAFSYENPADARRPNHTGRMKLNHLHVDEVCAHIRG